MATELNIPIQELIDALPPKAFGELAQAINKRRITALLGPESIPFKLEQSIGFGWLLYYIQFSIRYDHGMAKDMLYNDYFSNRNWGTGKDDKTLPEMTPVTASTILLKMSAKYEENLQAEKLLPKLEDR